MKPSLIWLPTHKQEGRGTITIAEYGNESVLPFCPKRAFYIYGVPMHIVRGGHGHKECEQFMIAITGMVLIKLDDGTEFLLDRPDMGLYLPPGDIMRMIFLTGGACLLVLASHAFDPDDYIYPDGAKG